MTSTRRLALAGLILSLLSGAAIHAQQDAQMPDVDWQTGTVSIGNMAQLRMGPEFQFTGPAGTKTLMEMMQNPVGGHELGLVAPQNVDADGDWFVIFEFSEVGYVRDDEKDKLDADAILESIREGTASANEERKKRGWAALEIVGWQTSPRYNDATKNLEWAISAQSEGRPVLNHNTRILGRSGVMEASLVCSPEQYETAKRKCNELLASFVFTSGNTYAEFREGDRIAEYGLTGLIAGGTVAAAAKAGLLKKFWKLIVAAFVGAAAFIKKFFKGSDNPPKQA